MKDKQELPPAVTFRSGAELLIRLGIVDSITHQGIRYIATTRTDWPFGPGKKHSYWTVGNATVMATKPFLTFFRKNPTAGRGPDKKPRAPRVQR
ncbi:hypothetical protein [Streptomyces bottropensis]|uniref:hypothetical protein n=1 Tax=Streptomyces bottropensis TaxID=42235 RepID=UPI0036BD286B